MIYDKIKVISVYDGDTPTLEIDTFINRQYFRGPCRLLGINAPEMDSEGGKPSKLYLARLLGKKKKLRAEIKGDDKYGRPLVKMEVKKDKNWMDVNQIMLDKGYAVPMLMAKQKIQTKNPHLKVSSKNFFKK